MFRVWRGCFIQRIKDMDFLDNYRDLKNKTTDLSKYSLEELEELERLAELRYKEYDNLQLVIKRNCNSLYGSTASEYFDFCDTDIGEDITTISKHFAILVDIAINKYLASWHDKPEALHTIRKFYPDTVELKNLDYIRDKPYKDVCVYGDTDSRYIDLEQVYHLIVSPNGIRELPPSTPEGNKELADFSIFFNEEFLKHIIQEAIDSDLEYRNGNKGHLRMSHETTARKSVLLSKKMYIMPLIWKDGVYTIENPKLKYMGVSLKRGETTAELKKIIEKLIRKYLVDDYSIDEIAKECRKIKTYIIKNNKKKFVCRSTSVSGVKDMTFETNERGDKIWTIPKNHLQAQLIVNWANFIEENSLTNEYKHAFEKQKMYYYKTLDSKYAAIGVPDDVDIDTVPNMPPINWHEMINQQFLKPLMKCLFDYPDKYQITDNDCNDFLIGMKHKKIF